MKSFTKQQLVEELRAISARGFIPSTSGTTDDDIAIIAPDSTFTVSPEDSERRATEKDGCWRRATSMHSKYSCCAGQPTLGGVPLREDREEQECGEHGQVMSGLESCRATGAKCQNRHDRCENEQHDLLASQSEGDGRVDPD